MKIPLPVLPAAPPLPAAEIDPNAPAAEGSFFGLPTPLEEATLVAVPVPYEATVSSAGGTVDGPAALIAASAQVDLLEPLFGEPWRLGLAVLEEPEGMRNIALTAAGLADAVRRGEAAPQAVDAVGEAVWDWLETITGRLLDTGRIPLVIGGEHGVSLGAFRAAARRCAGLGILQIDAHADLRQAYEGFRTSHASIMRRALELPGVDRIVQVGLRDFCREEAEARDSFAGRTVWFPDHLLGARQLEGEPFARLAREIVGALPQDVWVSFDIDGLDPALCPGTGTPVPGGLSWREAALLVRTLTDLGRRVVGIDLVEIGNGNWDGFVAAKLLYLLAGVAARTGAASSRI